MNCTTTGYEKKGDGTACQLKTYTITFDKNDGTTGTTAVHATTTVNHGTTSVKTPNTNPTRDVLNGS